MCRHLRSRVVLFALAAVAVFAGSPAGAQNLLSNPAFTSDVSSWTTEDTTLEVVWRSDLGSTLSGGSGAGSLEVRHSFWNGGSGGPGQRVPVTAGHAYELAASILRPGNPDNVSNWLGLYIFWFTSEDRLLTTDGVAMWPLVDDTWTRVTSTFVAPANAATAWIGLMVGNPILENETRPGIGVFDDLWFAPEGATTATQVLYYPAAAEALGQQGTHWRTSGRFSNLVDFPVTISGALLRQNQDNSAAIASPVVLGTIPARGHLAVDDLVSALGGNGMTAGVYLLAEAQAAGLPADLVNATSYTWTPNGSGPGGYGQGLPAVGAGTRAAVTIPGLYQGDAYRTNLGILNTSNEPIEVDVTIRDDGGAAVSTNRWVLSPYEQRQVGLPSLGVATLDGGTASFKRASSSGSFRAYASTVDQLSGDAIYSEAR